MPKFNVSFVSRLWLDVEINAPTREIAEERAQQKIDRCMNENGIGRIDGKNEHCGTTNLSLLNKLPK